MKRMLWLVACTAAVFWMSAATAQAAAVTHGLAGGSGTHNGHGGMDAILSQLNLTSTQETEVQKLREELRSETDNAHGNKSAIRQATQNFWSRVRQILTSAQLQELNQLLGERGHAHGRRVGGGHSRHAQSVPGRQSAHHANTVGLRNISRET